FGQEYFWRVKSSDDLNTSDWSVVFSFTTFSEITPKKPKDGEDGEDLRPKFTWKTKVGDNDLTGGVDGFEIDIDTTDTFDSPLHETFFAEGVVFHYFSPFLNFGTEYKWRMRAHNPNDVGTWTEIRSFETLPSTELNKPGDGENNVDIDVEFSWDNLGINDDDDIPDVYTYTMQIATDETFTEPVSYVTLETKISIDILKFGTEYFWKVKAAHISDTSAWTPTRNFEVVTSVELDSPADGLALPDLRPTLKWNTLNGVEGYQLKLANNASFNDALYAIILGEDKDTYAVDPLEKDEDYYWSVRAFNVSDSSAWADAYTFNTHSVGFEELTQIRELQVYPNPASTNAIVEFIAQANSTLTISLTDILGKVIMEKVIEVSSGTFKHNLALSELNKGVYFVEIKQNNQKSTVKLIVE
ncbi:MAG: hypothetical protein B7C24_08215, partial [Bacteroidetes bacterium 4572_77]